MAVLNIAETGLHLAPPVGGIGLGAVEQSLDLGGVAQTPGGASRAVELLGLRPRSAAGQLTVDDGVLAEAQGVETPGEDRPIDPSRRYERTQVAA